MAAILCRPQCVNTMTADGPVMPCSALHDDFMKWKNFPHYWPFVRGIHRSPVNIPHRGQCRRALMFSLICVWINGWVNNREAGDLRCYHAHYDITVMNILIPAPEGLLFYEVHSSSWANWQQVSLDFSSLFCFLVWTGPSTTLTHEVLWDLSSSWTDKWSRAKFVKIVWFWSQHCGCRWASTVRW